METALWQMIILVASMVIQAAMTPKQQQDAPVAFDDIDFPQIDEGTPQCIVFGDCWTGDWTVLAVGNYRVDSFTLEDAGKK